MSIRVQNAWFFFSVKDENLNFSKIEFFLSEISTANRNFRLSWKNSLKNWKIDVNYWTSQKVSNSIGWPYKTRLSLLDVQTFVEKKNNWNRTRIGDFQQKTFDWSEFIFFTSEKMRFYYGNWTHNTSVNFLMFTTLFFFKWIHKDNESPLIVKTYFARFHTVPKKSQNCVNLILIGMTLLFLVKKIASILYLKNFIRSI